MASSTSSVLSQLRRHGEGKSAQEAEEGDRRALTVGSYARISDAYEDRVTGVTEDGVKRQLTANEHIAQARGWTIADRLYVDNNLSAFKESVVRDDFEDLLDDLEAGVIDGIVCLNLDRFCRQVVDLERAIRIYDEARRQGRELLFATAEGDLNLASDDGLTMARVMVAFANKASRDTARRVSLKHQEIRDGGRQVGGSRPFGWDWDYEVVSTAADGSQVRGRRRHVLNEREARAIREAADDLISGSATWRDIVRRWNAAGLSTPRGKEWQPQTVKQVLRSPRLAGWLVHKGRIAVHSRTGKLIRSQSPAILSDETYEALLVAVEGRAGSGFSEASRPRRYLLAGIARCAECGARLAGNRRTDVHFYYACRVGNGQSRDGGNACGKVSVSGVELDRLITDLVLPRIIAETAGTPTAEERPHQAELLEAETKKDQLLAAYREGRATSELVFPEVVKLEEEIEGLRRLQAEWSRTQRILTRTEAVTEENWPGLDVEERRRHISRHIEAVYVSRATKRGARFDPARVSEPVWRTPGGA